MTGEVFGAHVPGLEIDPASLDAALQMCELTSTDHYVELGSGMGRGVIRAAHKYGAHATGVELMPHAAQHTRVRARETGCADRVHVRQGDLMQHDTSDADVVSLYLGPAFYDLLAPKLERELTPNARVITYGWQVPGWDLVDCRDDAPIQSFLYRPGRRGSSPNGTGAPATSAPVEQDSSPQVVIATLVRQTYGPERGARRWQSVS
jgi:hypothetical protein